MRQETPHGGHTLKTPVFAADIGKAIGRLKQTVDSYIADLRAATQLGLDIKISRMDRLGIPQDRIAKRSAQVRGTIRDHLAKIPEPAAGNHPNWFRCNLQERNGPIRGMQKIRS